MGHPTLLSSTFLLQSLLFCFFFSSCNSAGTSCALHSDQSPIKASPDRQSLLFFKSTIEDPRGSLSSWNDSLHHCKWYGVTCGCRHPERVTELDLSSSELTGAVSPALGNLTFLRKIDLSNNGFRGPIPPEFGHLFRLQHLSLDSNSLEGEVPKSLSQCSRLRNISMGSNKLQGELPRELGYLSSLTYLVLLNNSLSGSIPVAMGNLSSLTILDLSNNTLSGGLSAALIGNLSSLRVLELARNQLSGVIPPIIGNLSSLYYLDLSSNFISGEIPPTVGSLLSLGYLDLAHNALSGSIPPALGKLAAFEQLSLAFNNLTGEIPYSVWHNLSSLELIQLDTNPLSGSLPSDIGNALPHLRFLTIGECKIHGPIPMSLANASNLEVIQLGSNMLTGVIPPNLGSLQSLVSLVLYDNQLEAETQEDWSFLTTLANCTNLNILELDTNNLGGVLPHSMANLSRVLQFLTLGMNHISGSLPPEIGNLVGLNIFEASPNLLKGSIPESVGMLRGLHYLQLSVNSFSGEIPSTIGNLTLLNELYLDYNNLTGTIPSNIGSCQKLTLLNLRNNDITGAIPREIFISGLSRFLDLSLNSLTGSIPLEVGNLENLGILDFSGNKLSGQIPASLGKCQVLEALGMAENFLQGPIPSSFSALRGIRKLDLSYNNLSGSIPSFLKNFQGLYYLNLSFNKFEGEMPRGGVFDNASGISVSGNNNLCGGNPKLQLQPCHFHETKKKHTSLVVVIICISGVVLFSSLLFCSLAILYRIQNSRRKSLATIEMEGQHVKVSYAELVRATNGFSTSNLIGVGSFGSVYKGMLDENVVAVKVFNLQQRGASKSFIAECEALRNIRHRNLVRILTVCSSVDFQGNDFKAMVFEFMSNGNLESWLHPEENPQIITRKLNLLQRLNIAIDVASALDYLHHHGDMPIVHCDLKPSNILLQDDMTAHVSDFGLSKFLMETIRKSSSQSISSLGLKGTIGYIAPEYGMANKVSTSGDVYSYGILLLEMFTGKKPTDEIFREGRSLRTFVEMAIPEQVMYVMDSQLLLDEEDREANDVVQSTNDTRTLDCVVSLLRIGLACSNELGTERMEMGVVTRELQKLKDIFLKAGNNSNQQRF